MLENTALRKLLVELVGSSKVETIEHYTLVTFPIDMIAKDLVVSGCAPHECSDKSAVLLIDLEANEVHAAIYENEEIVIYSKQKTYDFLPEGLKYWVTRIIQKQLDEYGVRVKTRYN